MEQSLEAANRKIEQLQKQLDQMQGTALKAEIMTELSKPKHGIINAGQFYRLFCDNARREDSGSIVIEHDGLPRSVSELIDRIRLHGGNEHHFQQVKPETKSAAPKANPWRKGATWNLTEQGRIFKQNPELAARLKAEAQAS